jgi:threonine/homoserine/homoserine lactone efflux protein
MTFIWLGVLAGLGLAIPVGAMSIMLFQTAATKGWRFGAAGGAAMATVDFLYALATALLGAALAAYVATWGTALSAVGAGILLVLGAITIWRTIKAYRSTLAESNRTAEGSIAKTFATFVGATLVNPQTAIYFLAIAPSVAASNNGPDALASSSLFAFGVFIGSIAWQQVLAFSGSLLHKVSGKRLRFITGLIGGALVVSLAISMLLKALN